MSADPDKALSLALGLFLIQAIILAPGCSAGRDDGETTKTHRSTLDIESVSESPHNLGRAALFVLPTIDGAHFQLREHAGQVVIVNFWATWCAPCLEEMPGFVKLYNRFRDRGLVLAGISVDKDEPARLREFVGRLGVNYPILIDDGTVGATYKGNLVIPSTFVIDRQGYVRSRYIGIVDFEELAPLVEQLLMEDLPT